MLLRYFQYLDELREEGEANMFAAPAYLEAAFGLTKSEAREVCSAWMETFKPDLPLKERVRLAEKSS